MHNPNDLVIMHRLSETEATAIAAWLQLTTATVYYA